MFFDICSSTCIIEQLKATDSTGKWLDLIGQLDDYLHVHSKSVKFKIYKFLGDGWILLFEVNSSGRIVELFMNNLNQHFIKLLKNLVYPRLSDDKFHFGLMFGLDIGELFSVKLNGRKEYIGRPLNVAARLQSAIRDKDTFPGKAMLSPVLFSVWYTEKGITPLYKSIRARRYLKNILSGENHVCRKITLGDEVEDNQSIDEIMREPTRDEIPFKLPKRLAKLI